MLNVRQRSEYEGTGLNVVTYLNVSLQIQIGKIVQLCAGACTAAYKHMKEIENEERQHAEENFPVSKVTMCFKQGQDQKRYNNY